MYSIGRLFFPFSRPLSVNLLDNFVLASAGRIYWIFLSGARRLTYLTFFLVCLLDTSSGRLSASLRGVFSGVSRSFLSVYFVSYYVELDGYFVGHLTLRLFGIISGVSKSVISIYFQVFYGKII